MIQPRNRLLRLSLSADRLCRWRLTCSAHSTLFADRIWLGCARRISLINGAQRLPEEAAEMVEGYVKIFRPHFSLVPCDLPVVSCRFGPPEMGLKGGLKISGLDEEVVLSRG